MAEALIRGDPRNGGRRRNRQKTCCGTPLLTSLEIADPARPRCKETICSWQFNQIWTLGQNVGGVPCPVTAIVLAGRDIATPGLWPRGAQWPLSKEHSGALADQFTSGQCGENREQNQIGWSESRRWNVTAVGKVRHKALHSKP